jgi:hypothetical protein
VLSLMKMHWPSDCLLGMTFADFFDRAQRYARVGAAGVNFVALAATWKVE